MRILHINNSLAAGGAEQLVQNLAVGMHKKGNEVEILLLTDNENFFVEQLEQNGIPVNIIDRKNIYSFKNIFSIIPYLSKFDVVHVHLFPAQYWVAFASLFLFSKTKIITTEHSTYNRRRKKWYFRFIDNWIYGRYSSIIAISPETQISLSQWLISQHPIITINNGVPISLFSSAKEVDYRAEFNIPTNAKIVLMVGRFDSEKDHATLIRAFSKLAMFVHLLLVGGGYLMENCKQLVKTLNIQDRVHFLGLRKDVPNIIKAADVCTITSLWEGFGLVALEYMAAGKPVVASDVSGLNGLVGGAGVLFPAGNDVLLAKEISQLLVDKEYYKRIANLCLNRSKLYDIDTMVDAYLQLYKKIALKNE